MVKPLVIIVTIFVALVILYFIASPYQNCMREAKGLVTTKVNPFAKCLDKTNW